VDDLAFFDGPPLWPLPDYPVLVSVLFTWDISRGRGLATDWSSVSSRVELGGPAFGSYAGAFEPGLFVREGVTITSRGCPKACSFCLVHQREGFLRELEIRVGNIVQDNNVLACSKGHLEKVFGMLGGQRAIEFHGLDIDYLNSWVVDRLKSLKVKFLWVACDTDAALTRLDKAADLLADFTLEQRRCYVLIGRESLYQAESRCEAVFNKGFLPFAQLYQPVQPKAYSAEWKRLQKRWSRPAIYKKLMKSKKEY
jgi:hypothetical protein